MKNRQYYDGMDFTLDVEFDEIDLKNLLEYEKSVFMVRRNLPITVGDLQIDQPIKVIIRRNK